MAETPRQVAVKTAAPPQSAPSSGHSKPRGQYMKTKLGTEIPASMLEPDPTLTKTPSSSAPFDMEYAG
jgi:hypothetical protein